MCPYFDGRKCSLLDDEKWARFANFMKYANTPLIEFFCTAAYTSCQCYKERG
jgi:hypothetical protein